MQLVASLQGRVKQEAPIGPKGMLVQSRLGSNKSCGDCACQCQSESTQLLNTQRAPHRIDSRSDLFMGNMGLRIALLSHLR